MTEIPKARKDSTKEGKATATVEAKKAKPQPRPPVQDTSTGSGTLARRNLTEHTRMLDAA